MSKGLGGKIGCRDKNYRNYVEKTPFHKRFSCSKKNLNASRPSEHTPVRGKKCQNDAFRGQSCIFNHRTLLTSEQMTKKKERAPLPIFVPSCTGRIHSRLLTFQIKLDSLEFYTALRHRTPKRRVKPRRKREGFNRVFFCRERLVLTLFAFRASH